jgi:hypothetical protein
MNVLGSLSSYLNAKKLVADVAIATPMASFNSMDLIIGNIAFIVVRVLAEYLIVKIKSGKNGGQNGKETK